MSNMSNINFKDFCFKLKATCTTRNKRDKILERAYAWRYSNGNFLRVVKHFYINDSFYDVYPKTEFIGVTAVYRYDETEHALKIYLPDGTLAINEQFDFISESNKSTFKGVEYYKVSKLQYFELLYNPYKKFLNFIVTDSEEIWFRNGLELETTYWNGTQDAIIEATENAHNNLKAKGLL